MSRYALAALVCLFVIAAAASLTPAADTRQLALVFPPGTAKEAMFLAAARLDLRPVAQPGRWPILIAATGEGGWRGLPGSSPYVLAIAVDRTGGCDGPPLT